MNSFNNLVQTTINSPKPNYTPAEKPLIVDLENNFNAAVQNGLEPEKIVKMVSIIDKEYICEVKYYKGLGTMYTYTKNSK